MGAQNDRVIFCELPDEFSDLYNLLWIQSDGRFIQDNRFRKSQDCLCQSYSLAVSFGQIFNQPLPDIVDLHHLHNLFDFRLSAVPCHLL